MEIINFVGYLFIFIIVAVLSFIIGMIFGNWSKTVGIENSGYKIIYTPGSRRKYLILDVSGDDSGFDPTSSLYEKLFRRDQ